MSDERRPEEASNPEEIKEEKSSSPVSYGDPSFAFESGDDFYFRTYRQNRDEKIEQLSDDELLRILSEKSPEERERILNTSVRLREELRQEFPELRELGDLDDFVPDRIEELGLFRANRLIRFAKLAIWQQRNLLQGEPASQPTSPDKQDAPGNQIDRANGTTDSPREQCGTGQRLSAPEIGERHSYFGEDLVASPAPNAGSPAGAI